MLLHLFSDANYNLLGFNATYTFSLCPGVCGGHGRCDSSTSKCHCHQGWGGPSCTTPLCTQACSVNGQCDKVRVGIGTIKWTHTKNIYYSRTVTRFSTWLGYSFVCRDETFHICLHSFIYFFRKESVVCVSQASWVKTASLVSIMTAVQGSGGVWVKKTPTHLPGQLLQACTSPPQEPCTCLAVRATYS